MTTIDLAYGARPLRVALPPNTVQVLRPPSSSGRLDYLAAYREAWAAPVGRPPLERLVRPGDRVAVVLPDETRWFPRRAALLATLERLGAADERVTLLIANGNHPQRDPALLELGEDLLRRFRIVNHDSRDAASLAPLGTTSTGLRVTMNRAAAEADLRVAMGTVKPHYFMGYTGGAKNLVPGVAGAETIAANHAKRADPTARLGRVEGNRLRAEIEEAAALAGPAASLNSVVNERRELVGAAAGDLVAAHRAAVEACRPLAEVAARRADVVLISDPLPVTLNIYQSLKLLAVAAPILRPRGVCIVAAECPGGTGQLGPINDLIYKPWLARLLPEDHLCVLVSGLAPEEVAKTFFRAARTVEEAFALARAHLGFEGETVIAPEGGLLAPRVAEE